MTYRKPLDPGPHRIPIRYSVKVNGIQSATLTLPACFGLDVMAHHGTGIGNCRNCSDKHLCAMKNIHVGLDDRLEIHTQKQTTNPCATACRAADRQLAGQPENGDKSMAGIVIQTDIRITATVQGTTEVKQH